MKNTKNLFFEGVELSNLNWRDFRNHLHRSFFVLSTEILWAAEEGCTLIFSGIKTCGTPSRGSNMPLGAVAIVVDTLNEKVVETY